MLPRGKLGGASSRRLGSSQSSLAPLLPRVSSMHNVQTQHNSASNSNKLKNALENLNLIVQRRRFEKLARLIGGGVLIGGTTYGVNALLDLSRIRNADIPNTASDAISNPIGHSVDVVIALAVVYFCVVVYIFYFIFYSRKKVVEIRL